MPLIIMVALWLINRPYMMEFFNPETRLVGIIMLSIGALMIISGYFVMTKIATIEV
jgi:tight adherence protein B